VYDVTMACINRWLIAAIVSVLLFVAAIELAPTLIHAISGLLAGPAHTAGYCPAGSGPCP
jgi:hypothetical protein